MVKRYIDCSARELVVYQKELLQSIADSEGRGVNRDNWYSDNSIKIQEYYKCRICNFGADIIMLNNIFDASSSCRDNGLPEVAPEDTIHGIKRLTGRMVAINLEPAAVRRWRKSVWSLTEGRRATVENAKSSRHGR